MRHDGLLHEITEGRMRGKSTIGRRRIQLLHDVALKRAEKDKEGRMETGENYVKISLLYNRRLLMMTMMNDIPDVYWSTPCRDTRLPYESFP